MNHLAKKSEPKPVPIQIQRVKKTTDERNKQKVINKQMLLRKTVVREIGNNDADQTGGNHHSTAHTADSVPEEKENVSRSHDVGSVEGEEEKEEEIEIGTATVQSEASLPSSLPLTASVSAAVSGSNTAPTPIPVPVNVIDKEGKGVGAVEGGAVGKEGQSGVRMTSNDRLTTTLVTMNMKGLAEEVDVRSAAVAQYCAMYVHT